MIVGILFLSRLFACLFFVFCLSVVKTFIITFEPLEVETSYLAYIFH